MTYLEQLTQLAKVKNTESGLTHTVRPKPLTVIRGVHQESLRGRVIIYFILFINDMPQHLFGLCHTLIYAAPHRSH